MLFKQCVADHLKEWQMLPENLTATLSMHTFRIRCYRSMALAVACGAAVGLGLATVVAPAALAGAGFTAGGIKGRWYNV